MSHCLARSGPRQGTGSLLLVVQVALLAVLFLGACTAKVKSPEAEVKVPGVKVEVGESQGDFCPPGQAKKGRC